MLYSQSRTWLGHIFFGARQTVSSSRDTPLDSEYCTNLLLRVGHYRWSTNEPKAMRNSYFFWFVELPVPACTIALARSRLARQGSHHWMINHGRNLLIGVGRRTLWLLLISCKGARMVSNSAPIKRCFLLSSTRCPRPDSVGKLRMPKHIWL